MTSPPRGAPPRRSTATTRSSAKLAALKLQLPEDRRRRRLLLVAIAAAIAAGSYLISRVIPHDDLQQLLDDVSNTLGAWTYLIVGVFAFAETGAFIGLVVPGETMMLLGGAVAGQGAMGVYILIGIAWFRRLAGRTPPPPAPPPPPAAGPWPPAPGRAWPAAPPAPNRSSTTPPATAARRSSS